MIVSFSSFNDGSFAVASLISFSLGFETGRLEVSKWTCSAISSSVLPYAVLGSGALEAFVHYAFISPLKCSILMLHFVHLNARYPLKKPLKCSFNAHT